MKKTISLFLTIVMMLTLLSMPGNAMADEETADVTLSTNKISIKQFEYYTIPFTYGSGAQGALSFKSDNSNAYAQTVIFSSDGRQNISVVGLKPGKCKIKVYTKITGDSKKTVGTIQVTVKKNKTNSVDKIKKQLKKEVTVKQYAETEIRMLKRNVYLSGSEVGAWDLDFSYPKNCKISTEYQTHTLGHNYICSRKKGTVKLKVYAYPRRIGQYKGKIVKKGIYIGEMKVKTTAAKNNIIKKDLTLRYQKEECLKAFDLNWDVWDYPSTELGQKEFLRNILGVWYDREAAYTVRIDDCMVVKYNQRRSGNVNSDLFFYGYRPGKTTIKVFEKKSKKKSYVNVALINVTVDGNITLADISNKWYDEYRYLQMSDDESFNGAYKHLPIKNNGQSNLNIAPYRKRIYVLLDRTAPLYDTYRVQYTSLHPDYVTVEPDGTLEWKKHPKELTTPEMRTVPLISAKLTFVDGSEATYQFSYTAFD